MSCDRKRALATAAACRASAAVLVYAARLQLPRSWNAAVFAVLNPPLESNYPIFLEFLRAPSFLARAHVGAPAAPVIARRYEPSPSALRRLPACLHLRGERGDLRVREAERGARLLRCLGGERLDPAVHQALAIGRRHGERISGHLRGADERLDIHHLRAEVSSAVPAKLLSRAPSGDLV